MIGDLAIRVQGKAGRITLTRPHALNALTHSMILEIDAALGRWAVDPAIDLVVVDAEGQRAFCAGGDLVALYSAAKAGDLNAAADFWRAEYRLNARIANFAKPVVTLLHGLVLGGGVGLGCHASNRIVCETTQVALPECNIGLVPDAGSSLILAAAPGFLGEYLGLTGTRMTGPDAVFAGFADHFVRHAHWPVLLDQLCMNGTTDAIDDLQSAPGNSALGQILPELDQVFSDFDPSFALKTDLLQQALGTASPLSVLATLRLVGQARQLDRVEHALEAEFRFTSRALVQGDFADGIRALIVDKDNQPLWQHARIDMVPDADVDTMLAPVAAAKRVFGKVLITGGTGS